MSKITTEDCKGALEAAWPTRFGTDLSDQAGKWKRVSKTGKKGQPIVRLFYHESLPLQATVIEVNGALTSTVIKGFGPFDGDEESESEAMATMVERADSNAAWDFFTKYDCYSPSDFAFWVSPTKEMGDTWYCITPVTCFRKNGCQFDGQLDYIVARYLPEGDGEMTEGTFATALEPDEIKAELLKRGFVDDKEFAEFMGSVGG